MLIVTRFAGQSVMVGDDLTVSVQRIGPGLAVIVVAQRVREEDGERFEDIRKVELGNRESIPLGADCRCMLMAVRDDRIRPGFAAPRKTPVHRREVYDTIRRKASEKTDRPL